MLFVTCCVASSGLHASTNAIWHWSLFRVTGHDRISLSSFWCPGGDPNTLHTSMWNWGRMVRMSRFDSGGDCSLWTALIRWETERRANAEQYWVALYNICCLKAHMKVMGSSERQWCYVNMGNLEASLHWYEAGLPLALAPKNMMHLCICLLVNPSPVGSTEKKKSWPPQLAHLSMAHCQHPQTKQHCHLEHSPNILYCILSCVRGNKVSFFAVELHMLVHNKKCIE